MGTTEAIAGVRKAVETLAQVQETRAHAEAPVSMSAKIVSPANVVWTLTIRSGATKEAVSEIVQFTKDVEAGMVKGGWKPYGNGFANGHAAPVVAEAPTPAAPIAAASGAPPITPTPPPAPATTGQNGTAAANGKARKSPGKDFVLAQDGAPYCAIHGTPLQPSHYGGFYCPLPGDGKNGFCTARYNP